MSNESHIFNDQRFASPQAQAEFYERAAHLDPDYRAKLERALGGISQFMPDYGMVLTFDDAVKHVTEYDKFMNGPYQEHMARTMPFAYGGLDQNSFDKRPPGRPRTKPLPDPLAPKRRPGRPPKQKANATPVQQAKIEFDEAVKELRRQEALAKEWLRKETARIQQIHDQGLLPFKQIARQKQVELNRLKYGDENV